MMAGVTKNYRKKDNNVGPGMAEDGRADEKRCQESMNIDPGHSFKNK